MPLLLLMLMLMVYGEWPDITALTRRDAHCCVDGARRHLNIIISCSSVKAENEFEEEFAV